MDLCKVKKNNLQMQGSGSLPASKTTAVKRSRPTFAARKSRSTEPPSDTAKKEERPKRPKKVNFYN